MTPAMPGRFRLPQNVGEKAIGLSITGLMFQPAGNARWF
jgi:hypothetical protein